MIRLRIRVFNRVSSHSCSRLHCLLAFLLIAVACTASDAQPAQTTDIQVPPDQSRRVVEFPDKQEVFRRMGIFEDLARNAKADHLTHEQMIKVYENLGILYDLAGMFPQSVAATQHVIELIRDGPKDEVAEQYNILSSVHGLMGDLRQAEKDEMKALAIRQQIGDPLGIALTWTDIAALYCEENHYKKALEFAQKSYDVLGNRTDVIPFNHVAVLQTEAFALCGTHQCGKGLPIMQQALEESKAAFGPNSLSAAAQGFALGWVYWKNGETAEAAEWMRVSIARMKDFVGWGAPVYVNSMRQYARFLHQAGERDEARNAESEIHTIQSIVDARTMTTGRAEFLSPGKH